MEIKVQCRKDEDGVWHIEKPGKMFVRERRVVWMFEGLEPGIVPLLAFDDNPPHGPFSDVWLTASTFVAELAELPGTSTAHRYDIVLIRWNPDPDIAAKVRHELIIGADPACPIKVFWRRGKDPIQVDPEVLRVDGASLVEWHFDVPEDVFATIDFAGLRRSGPFAELHGRRADGVYRVTGQTDLVKEIYKYTISLYDRTHDTLVIRDDPKIDNNGDPIG
jgi:hypothetical protein